MKYISFIFIFLLSTFGFLGISNAQTIGGGDGELLIEFVPEIPKANELVSVVIKSYSTNIDLANFNWKIDGKTLQSGTGQNKFIFTMGDYGKRVNLSISIKTAEGANYEKNYSFLPSSVDLVWQTSGYVPPFYKGKALFGHQNTVSVVAIPHIPNKNGVEMNPKNMIYRWRKNGSVIENASGFGKNVYTFEGSLLSREVNISVEVTPQDESSIGYSSIKIKPVEPYILFYKKDPLYGIQFQKSLLGEEYFGNSNEISIFAVPFLHDIFSNEEYLSYKWSINGTPISDTVGTRNQTFRQKEGTSGTSKISLTVDNTSKILQYSTNNISLTFKENEN